MAKTPNVDASRLGELRAKAALFDELVEQLAATEDELDGLRRELIAARRAATRDGIDPAWRSIANDLAGALRPYSMFREQRVEGGRIRGDAGAGLDAARRTRGAQASGAAGGRRVLPRARRPGPRRRAPRHAKRSRGRVRGGVAAADDTGAGRAWPPMVARPGGRAAAGAAAPHRVGPRQKGRSSMTTSNGNGAVGELRRVALSRIQVQPDFNPRTARDAKKFAQLVASVREEGVLQPLLVSDDGDGGFRLIAGEGRYLAAGEAGVVEVPVLVRDVDERTGGLELALAENLSREDLDPVQEARAFQRLKDAGYTKKGIAERLGVSQKLVGDRLAILDIPAQLHGKIADGSIPPSAVKTLVALARIHPGLPGVVAARVTTPRPAVGRAADLGAGGRGSDRRARRRLRGR